MGPVLGPHAGTDRTRDTRVAEPWLPTPEDRRPGEGERLTPDAPHNGGRPPPPGTAPHHPRGTQPPQGMQARGTVLGPHTHTAAPTARGWRTRTACPVSGQSGEGQRLISDAPHNGGRRPPRGRPSATPTASNAGPQGRTLWGWCWVPTHRPHPGHTGRGTQAARSRGRAAWGGTAPDTRRPSQRWQTTPPGDGPPPPPRHASPTGHAGQEDMIGPPHPHTRAHSTWVADPNSPPSGRAAGGGTAPDLRVPSQWWKAPPTGTPFLHPHSEQRQTARAHAVGPVLGPHAHTDRTRDTRVAGAWPPAPEDGRPGEGQRLTPDAPHNGGRPPLSGDSPPPAPRHAAPTEHAGQKDSVGPPHPHNRAHSTWVADPNSPPSRRAVGGGTAPDLRRPSHNGGGHPPRGHPSATPTASNASPQGRPQRPQPEHTGRGTPAARPRGRAVGGGTAPDNRRPSQRWQATPSREGPLPTQQHAAPTGHAGQGDSVWPPHPHARAHSTWVVDPNSPPSERTIGGGGAPDIRRPSHNGGRNPPEDALLPTQRRAAPARKGARCGAGAGSPRPHRLHPGHRGRGVKSP